MKNIGIFTFLYISFLLGAYTSQAVPMQDDIIKPPHPIFSNWEMEELLPGGRFDAVAYLGNDVVIMGSRGKNPGHIFRSNDLGKTWKKIANVTAEEIFCLASGGDGKAFLLTRNLNLYHSENFGKTWKWLAKISDNERSVRSYGLMVTEKGSILVSDTGGHIHRSTDQGGTWTDLGPLSDKGLYRFERTRNCIIVNGWEGSILKSHDDGVIWNKTQHLCDSPLYATEYLGANIMLQASESGHIFRSKDCGENWVDLGKLTEAADDFVKLGTGVVLLTTYTEGKNMYLSLDWGKNWENIGKINPNVPEDWFDHVIYIDKLDKVVMVGGTNKGFSVRAEIFRDSY